MASALFVHSPRLNWFEIKLKLPAKFLCAWNTFASTRKTQNYCGKLHVCAFILEPHCLIKLFLRIWLHSFRDRLPFKENNHHLWTIVLFRCITIWAKGVFRRETQSKESHIYIPLGLCAQRRCQFLICTHSSADTVAQCSKNGHQSCVASSESEI